MGFETNLCLICLGILPSERRSSNTLQAEESILKQDQRKVLMAMHIRKLYWERNGELLVEGNHLTQI